MIHKVLPPGVQNPDGPYPCAKMLRIIGELHERLVLAALKLVPEMAVVAAGFLIFFIHP